MIEEEDKFLKENPIVFKKYKVKKKLGEGSFGKIYTSYDINTKEEFAVKLVCKLFFYEIIFS